MEYRYTKYPTPELIEKWNLFVAAQNTGSLFQMPVWKDLFNQKKNQWIYFWGDEENQIRFVALIRGRGVPFLGLYFYIERGPVCDDSISLLEGMQALISFLRGEKAIRLTVNPYWEFPGGEEVEKGLEQLGFISSQRKSDSHFETLTIDLNKPSNEIFRNFRGDTRWRIKQSEKLGVSVSPAREERDVRIFYQLLYNMSQKKPMVIPNYGFFLKLWKSILKDQQSGTLLMASYKDRLLSGIILLKHGARAVYTWGASETEHLDKISKSHLVLWEGILWAKGQGCSIFDMGGFAGTTGENPELERIDAFKKGFGGRYCRLIKIHSFIFQKQKEKLVRFFFLNRKRGV